MAGGGAAVEKAITFEQAWPILQEEAIDKLINYLELEGLRNSQLFTSCDYMRLYTIIYNLSSPNPTGPEAQKLYDQYKRTFEDYISSMVFPSLRGKKNEDLLRELLRRWKNHVIMTRWLSRFFHYLDRYFVPIKKLPSLAGTSHFAFYNLVYGEINDQVRDTIISLIDREREGEEIDQTLVKEILDIYVEIGEGSLKYYIKDFEEAMVNASAKFYSRKALDWITSESYEDYKLKVEDCLNQEKSRVSNYLRFRSKDKLLEVVEHELVSMHASKLEEKKQLPNSSA